jgi:hypothetical protein
MSLNSSQPVRRPSRLVVFGLIGTVIVAAVIVTVLALVVLGREGNVAADAASPTPTDIPAPSALQSSHTQAPSPSAAVTPEPTIAALTADAMASVTVNELNLRMEPAAGAKSVGHFSAGARVFVLQGPKEADGYAWYQVAPADDRFVAAACEGWCGHAIGWVAGAGADGERWLDPANLDCIKHPSLDELPQDGLQRLACYGSRTLAFEGVVRQPCCGYVGAYVFTPDWLANPTPHTYFDDPFLGLRFRPGHDWPELEYADIVRVSGHFDDRAAMGCGVEVADIAENELDEVDPMTAAYEPLACRQEFVVESIEVIGNTGEKCGC